MSNTPLADAIQIPREPAHPCEYKILQALSGHELQDAVNAHLKSGWVLHGELHINDTSTHEGIYTQVVTLTEKT